MVLNTDLLRDKVPFHLPRKPFLVLVLTLPLHSHYQGSETHRQSPPSVPAAHSGHPESDLCLLNEEAWKRCTAVCCCGERVGCMESQVLEVREGGCPG